MALNRDKFRNIVGGITTAEQPEPPSADADEPPAAVVARPEEVPSSAGQGRLSARESAEAKEARTGEHHRFAKRGRPKGRPPGETRKVKVSLFLSETLVNDLYDWAHDDRIHPGEMFERALKPFHEREAKRRNAGKE